MSADNEPTMRDQIVAMIIDALRKQGHPDLSVQTVRTDPAHREAFVEMLQACRPMPVITRLIADVRASRF